MKGIVWITVALCLLVAGQAEGKGVRVRGYVKADGTYVAPHYRSAPNSSVSDNYSTRGNYNPYTGQAGKKDPYAIPPQSGGYGAGYPSNAPVSTYSQQVDSRAPGPAESTAYRLADSDGGWPRFNTAAAEGQEDVNDLEPYGRARVHYLTSATGSLCNEFLLAADEMARSAETLAKCASRMDPRHTCAVEADDAMQSSIRYQVSASKAQSYCPGPY